MKEVMAGVAMGLVVFVLLPFMVISSLFRLINAIEADEKQKQATCHCQCCKEGEGM